MEIYKIVGFNEFEFKDHPGIKWVSLHCVTERKGVEGLAVERVALRLENVCGGQIELNKKCRIYFNRFGKVDSVELFDD